MTVIIAAESVVWLRRAQSFLFAIAIVLLGYTGFVVADTWLFQQRENVRLEQIAKPTEADANSTVAEPAVFEEGLIGRVGISRLGMSAIVMEGTGTRTLRRAVGHIAGTAMPGQPGNSGIAGHRDTFFRPLRNVVEGDIVTLATPAGDYRYRVVSARIVGPDDVSVLEANDREVLTLVTCYPFYFVGPAPNRFIVRAERVS